MKRLFVAIPLPEKIQQTIENQIEKKLEKEDKNIKIVPVSNRHITLQFFGETPEEKIPGIIQQLDFLQQTNQFRLELSSAGSFGNHVLWIGIQDTENRLQKIAEKLGNKTFSAHITLARNKNLSARAWQALVQKIQSLPMNQNWMVSKIVLFESIFVQGGNEYKKIHEWKLS